MLQVIIFAGLVLVSVLLIAVTFWKKLCGKPFYGILAVSAAACLLGAVSAAAMLGGGKSGGNAELKKSLYVASRLLQDNRAFQAVNALGDAAQIDEKNQDVVFLQALSLNQCSSFTLSEQLTEESNDERLAEISESNNSDAVMDSERVEELTEEVIDDLSLSEKEQEELEMWMRLRYYSDSSDEEETGEKRTDIQIASRNGDYSEAFSLAADQAANGNVSDKVLLSEMFVNNYEPYDYSNSDEEMDELLAEVTKLQIELEKMESVMKEESHETDTVDNLDYELKTTEYEMALTDLERAPVLRAINYLKENKPDENGALGYHLQMAKLYYLADMEDEADKHMDQIFVETEMERSQWLGLECLMLRDSFFELLDDPESDMFDDAYEVLFEGLNQGIYMQKSGLKSGFKSYMTTYLRELYTGIRITDIKVSGYPQMTSVLSYAGTEELTEKDIQVFDTGHEIDTFTLEKSDDNSLAICFVLDRSGSMQGDRIANAKNAISQFVGNVDEGIQMGLVTFAGDASIDAALTESKAAINGLVGNVVASGGTNIASGLEMGANILQGFSGRKVIVLLSDGADGNASAIDSVLGTLAGQDIPVYSIGLSGADNSYMQNIADTTGGTFIAAEGSGELYGIYSIIQKYIMNTYILTYEVTGETEVKERELRVELTESPSFDTEEYYLGLPESNKQERKRVPAANYYRQTGGSWRGEE